MAKLMIQLDREELNNLQYPIIVECWDKSFGSLRFKREYKKAFTENERKLVREYYNKFYRWYLVTGTPESAVMSPNTIETIHKAVNFFAMN